MDFNKMNIGVLAYLGDAVYELEVRSYLIRKMNYKVNELDKQATNYVSAISQSGIIDELTLNNILTEDEISLIKRARNYKTHSKPRYVDIKTYKKATSLEVLFGALYLSGKTARIKELMKEITGD